MNKKKLSEGAIIFLIDESFALLNNLFRSDGLPLVQIKPASVSFSTKNNQESNVSFEVLKGKFKKPGIILIDVRSPQEFKKEHIPWAINISYHEFSEKLPEIMKQISFSQEIIVYCGGIGKPGGKNKAFFFNAKG